MLRQELAGQPATPAHAPGKKGHPAVPPTPPILTIPSGPATPPTGSRKTPR